MKLLNVKNDINKTCDIFAKNKKKKLHTYKHVPFYMYKHYICLNIWEYMIYEN